MRVLFLANDGEGLYKFRKELPQALINDGNEVYISLPRDKYIPMLEEMGCKYIETSFNRKGTNPFSDLKLLKFYESIINKVKPNVVLTYTIKPNVYGGLACARNNVPCIATITGLGSAVENKGILQIITLFLYKLGLKKDKKVFFQNAFNRDFLIKKKIVNEKQCVLVMGSGVNLKDYKLLNYPKSDTIDFVYIGRIMTEKGFGIYAKAAEYIHKKYNNTRFHVAGEYEDDYKQLVEKLVDEEVLIYHGSVIDMINEIYRQIHCTIHPTYYAEGMSNVLLESCASGRPIITTDRPGCKEVVDDGVNGFVVKQKDVNDLITKIEKFINLSYEERKNMGINGRKKIESQFSRDIVIGKYLDEIKKY